MRTTRNAWYHYQRTEWLCVLWQASRSCLPGGGDCQRKRRRRRPFLDLFVDLRREGCPTFELEIAIAPCALTEKERNLRPVSHLGFGQTQRPLHSLRDMIGSCRCHHHHHHHFCINWPSHYRSARMFRLERGSFENLKPGAGTEAERQEIRRVAGRNSFGRSDSLAYHVRNTAFTTKVVQQ